MKRFMKRVTAIVMTILLALPTGFGFSEEQGMSLSDAIVTSSDAVYTSDDVITADAAINADVGSDSEEEVSSGAVDPVVGEADDVELGGEEDPAPEETAVTTYWFLVNDELYDEQTVGDGEALIQPEDPTAPEGSVFAGWFLEDGTQLFVDGEEIVHADPERPFVNVVARFEDAAEPGEDEPADDDTGDIPADTDTGDTSVDTETDAAPGGDSASDEGETNAPDDESGEDGAEAAPEKSETDEANAPDRDQVENGEDSDKTESDETSDDAQNDAEGEAGETPADEQDGESETSDGEQNDAEGKEGENPADEQEDGEEIQPVRVTFSTEPEDAVVTVFAVQNNDEGTEEGKEEEVEVEKEAEQGEPEAVEAEEDGMYLLLPGEYVYNATAEGYITVEAVLFTVADEALEINIELEAEEGEKPEEPTPFDQSCTVGSVTITVRADAGAFPAGAELDVGLVNIQARREADEAIDEIRDEDKNVAAAYTYDIKVVDEEGNELQPAEGYKVEVSFAMAQAADENLEANVYHVTEDGGELTAEKLEAEAEGETVTAVSEGFSLYTVEFTYNTLEFVLQGGQDVALSEILSELGLTGMPTAVEVSDESLFDATLENGEYVVEAKRPFNSEEWMKVTIDGIYYEIAVTDATSGTGTQADPYVVDTWGELQTALNAGGHVKLNKDITAGTGDAALEVLSGTTVTLDLNGKKIDRNLASATEAVTGGNVITVNDDGTLTVTGNGMITGGNTTGSGGGVYVVGMFTLESGSITGNTAAKYGGGVVAHETGQFKMNGGTISGNSAGSGGGGVDVYKSAFAMTGGEITGNSSTGDGGGVYVDGTITLEGGIISSNSATGNGGGVFLYRGWNAAPTMNLKGSPSIINNKKGSDINNTYVPTGTTITVTGNLVGASLGVTMQTPGVFTSGLNDNGDNSSFTSDSPACVVRLTDDDEAELEKLNTFTKLQQKINEAADTDNKTLVLDLDYEYDSKIDVMDSLMIAFSQTVTIDLNGHTINRKRQNTWVQSDKHVFYVGGTLTLEDNSDEQIGKVTGGYCDYGGGVYVASGGMFNMSGGIITGNTAKAGGGVYVAAGSTFNMTGGSITGNRALGYEESGKNYYGGGVDVYGTFKISDSPVITGNNKGKVNSKVANNVECAEGKIIVNGTLSKDARFGVSLSEERTNANDMTFTSGLSGRLGEGAEATTIFTSDDAAYVVRLNADGEAKLVEKGWAALQADITAAGNTPMTFKVSDYADENKKVTAKATDGPLTIAAGQTITLNLNGFTIDRGLAEADAVDGGNVITVNGALTVTDGSKDGTGAITGGNNSGNGGGVYVEAGTFTFSGGAIVGNSAGYGGGVYVCYDSAQDHGTLKVSGKASITDNADLDGNASNVYLPGNAKIDIAGALDEKTAIGVGMEAPGAFTGGLKGKDTNPNGTTGNFPSDDYDYLTVIDDQGEAALISAWRWVQGELAKGGTVTLEKDIRCIDQDDGPLVVPAGVSSGIDLNGHTIDRGLSKANAVADGHVITVKGELKVHDATGMSDVITGGNSTGNGGGIRVDGGALEVYDGVTISGNSAANGGGVYVHNGDFKITGTTIYGNAATCGGGLYIDNDDARAYAHGLENANIKENKAVEGGGGIYLANGAATLGLLVKITGNEALENGANEKVLAGGGAYVRNGTLEMADDAKITENSAATGGGVYVHFDDQYKGELSVSGLTEVYANVNLDGKASNVYLSDDAVIDIADALEDSAVFGVTTETAPTKGDPVVLTDGLKGKGSIERFASDVDDAGYVVVETAMGEAMLCVPLTVSFDTYQHGEVNLIAISGQEPTGNDIVICNDILTLEVKPAVGWRLVKDGLKAEYEDANGQQAVIATENTDPGEEGTYDVTMPGADVTITAAFELIPAAEPVIDDEPALEGAAALTYGETGSLSIGAQTGSDQVLSYQWYSCDSEGGDAKAIEGATGAVCDLSARMDAGTYYFLCDVTATRNDNGEKNTKRSGVVKVTVQPKTLEVYAEPRSKIEGEKDPALTYSVYGLVGADRLSGALTREPGELPGTYAIKQGTLAASANYAMTFTGANFIIGEKPALIFNGDISQVATAAPVGKDALAYGWSKVDGAEGYDLYFKKCDGKSGYQLIETLDGTDILNSEVTGLKKGTSYKAYIMAWRKEAGQKVYIGKASPYIHAIAGGYSKAKKICNAKSVKVKKANVSLTVGGKSRIKARVVGVKKGYKVLKHVARLRYYSSDKTVAKVNKKGRITAVAPGTCIIYVMANNGVYATVNVTVIN